MARRKAQDAPPQRRSPLWTTNLRAGLEHVGGGDLAVALPKLRAERDAWCLDNGCYRTGKTCAELNGRSCDAARKAGRQ